MMRGVCAGAVVMCVLIFAYLSTPYSEAKTSHATNHVSRSSSSGTASTSSSSFTFISAPEPSLLITEIMYDPPGTNTGRQWVEVANVGTGADAASVDLSAKTWRLFDTVSKGTASDAHLITAYANGSTILALGAVAVIAENPAKFLADWPHYSGILLKSAFSLNEAGTVGISNAGGTVLDAVNYTSAEGAKGDGNSLQRSSVSDTSSNGFVAGAPTPGMYASPVPAPITAPAKVKQISSRGSTTTGTTHSNVSELLTPKTYDSGMTAPADSADAASAGALAPTNIGALAPTTNGVSILAKIAALVTSEFAALIPLISSEWFAGFIALLGFSSFSLIVLQRQYYV